LATDHTLTVRAAMRSWNMSQPTFWLLRPDRTMTNLTADQLLAKLYALRKDYADDPEDETFQAINAAFLFLSYRMSEFKDFVKSESEKAKPA
jgi:hypothetical protein